jgi:hypothetical protein
MTDKTREESQAFAEKMRNEGAAGFAAGLTPWDSWDDFEERAGSRVWQGTAKHVAKQKDPARSFSDRILTTMAALAAATLAIGIAGVFFTQQSAVQIAENNAQLPPTSPAADIITKIDMAAGFQDGNPALPGILTALNEQPAPAAGAAHIPPTKTMPSETTGEAAADKQAEAPDINTAEKENNTPVQPVQLSKTGMLDVRTEPEQLPARDISENEQSVNNGGDWSINLASYLKNTTAEKMRKRFLDKGVATDLVTVTVKGTTYYRLRVTGIENRNMALIQSTIIKEQLGLEETWITKE